MGEKNKKGKNTYLQKVHWYLLLYQKLFVQGLKGRMSYRADFLVSLLATVAYNVMGYLTFWVIFENFNSIGGYSYYQMIFIYGIYLMSISPCQILFSNNWALGEKVFSGDFIIFCIKPINPFFYFYSETFDFNSCAQLLLGCGVTGYAWSKLNLQFTLFRAVSLVMGVFFASLVVISMMVFIGALSFYIINSDDILGLAERLKQYARYPATIYNGVFVIIFSFVIPLCYMAFYPAVVILDNKFTSVSTYLSPIVGIVFFYASYRFWIYSSRRYVGTGS